MATAIPALSMRETCPKTTALQGRYNDRISDARPFQASSRGSPIVPTLRFSHLDAEFVHVAFDAGLAVAAVGA